MRFRFGLDPIEFAATERTYFWMERSVSSFWLEHPRRSAAFPHPTSADLLKLRRLGIFASKTCGSCSDQLKPDDISDS